MAAPNKQPSGSRPGPGTAHTHAPHEGGHPSGSGRANLGQGVAPHGTPAPLKDTKKNPLH